MADELHHRYPSTLTAARLARHDLAAYLEAHAQRELIPSASLLVDELVVNAIVHAGGTVEVRARLPGPSLHVEVVDGDRQLPHMREPDIDGGHGLHIVDAIAESWGVTPVDGNGKATWFVL